MNVHEQDETKIQKFGGIKSRIIDSTISKHNCKQKNNLRIIFDPISELYRRIM